MFPIKTPKLLYFAACSSSLGMEDGRITEYYLITSSFFKIAHEPHKLDANYGRLNGPYAWCSQEQRRNNGRNIAEYFQINFEKFTKVTKVATQVKVFFSKTNGLGEFSNIKHSIIGYNTKPVFA